MTNCIFQKTLIIGVGLIGSSIARALREHGISSEIYGVDSSDDVLEKPYSGPLFSMPAIG